MELKERHKIILADKLDQEPNFSAATTLHNLKYTKIEEAAIELANEVSQERAVGFIDWKEKSDWIWYDDGEWQHFETDVVVTTAELYAEYLKTLNA